MIDRNSAWDLLPAYALGAASAEEGRDLEALLRDWPEGRDELRRLLATADSLAALPDEVAPSPALEGRIIAHARRRDRRRGRLRSVPLPGSARRRFGVIHVLAAAFATLAALFGVLAFQSDAEVVGGVWVDLLRGEGQAAEGQAYTVRWDGRPSAIVFRGLPPPPAGSTYLLWRLHEDGTIAPDRTFGLGPGGWATVIPAPVEGPRIEGFALSTEPLDAPPPDRPADPLYFPVK